MLSSLHVLTPLSSCSLNVNHTRLISIEEGDLGLRRLRLISVIIITVCNVRCKARMVLIKQARLGAGWVRGHGARWVREARREAP